MLCERCGTDNPEGAVVCVQCYYAVGIAYTVSMKGVPKKGNGKAPAWAAGMGLTDIEVRQVAVQLGEAVRGDVLAYWFASRDEAVETQKALADTIGQDLQAKKAKVGIFTLQGRTALFVAGKVSDVETVKMVCDSFNGEPAVAGAAAGK